MPSEHTLLVEGESDLHAVRNLVYTHDILVHYDQDIDSPGLDSCAFEIKTVDSDDTSGGQSKFPRAVKSHLALQDLQTLGIVADADDDFPGSWEARVNELLLFEEDRVFTSLEDYDVRNGWIDQTRNQIGDSVRVGVWIMPDNESRGALEEFAMELVPEDDELWGYSDEVIEGLPERRFDPNDEGKAHIHTWLAWQQTPREPIGRALTQGVLAPESALALRFVDWVRRLFPTLETGA